MPRIRIIVLGQTKLPFLSEGQKFYLDRLRHYAAVEWTELRASSINRKSSARSIREQEGKSIMKSLMERDYVFALDQKGDAFDSIDLARHIEKLSMVQDRMTFVIGGVLGLSENVLKRAQTVISLSRFTLTHEMSRLFLLEQLYRAFTIIRGEKYHK